MTHHNSRIRSAVMQARRCRRHSWQMSEGVRDAFRVLSREAMVEARHMAYLRDTE